MKAKHLGQLMFLGITIVWLSILAIPAGAQVNIQVGILPPPPCIVRAAAGGRIA